MGILLRSVISGVALGLAGSALAGDPIPGVDVSLEQIPGGKIASQSQCLNRGGKILKKDSGTYCALP